MPTAIDPTIGGAASNSYTDVATADTYFDNRVNSGAWNNVVDSDDKTRALIMATDRLDQEKYVGAQASTVQRLKWPRTGVIREGVYLGSGVLPKELIQAELELALEILRSGTTDIFAPTGLEPFKDIKAGSVDITMRDAPREQDKNDPAATSWAVQRMQLPPQVQRLLRDFIISDVPKAAILPSTSHVSRS